MAAEFGDSVHVIGATGRTGVVLCRMLAARGTPVVAVVRDPARWAALRLAGEVRRADLTDPASVAAALAGAARVVSVSYAAWTRAVLDGAPAKARVVVVGTARRYSRLPDAAAAAARTAEAEVLARGPDTVILHPTMIYGAPADGTVDRLAGLIARWRVLPLPGGGRALVQPIHVADVAECVVAALDRPWPEPATITIGGPAALPYRELVRRVAAARGVRPPLIVTVPEWLVRLGGRRRPALLRLLEDRVADVAAMRARLGVAGRTLVEGLRVEGLRAEGLRAEGLRAEQGRAAAARQPD